SANVAVLCLVARRLIAAGFGGAASSTAVAAGAVAAPPLFRMHPPPAPALAPGGGRRGRACGPFFPPPPPPPPPRRRRGRRPRPAVVGPLRPRLRRRAPGEVAGRAPAAHPAPARRLPAAPTGRRLEGAAGREGALRVPRRRRGGRRSLHAPGERQHHRLRTVR